MKRVLIIKTGRTETFAGSSLKAPSLGDIVRSTVLLTAFAKDHVSWVTSADAAPLLELFPSVRQVLTERAPRFSLSDFDVILNLEKDPAWTERLRNFDGEAYGFVDSQGGYRVREERLPALTLGKIPWQWGLFQLMGREWQNEDYAEIKPPRGLVDPEFDVGLNWVVGPKWPSKAWPEERWRRLAEKLSGNHRVSWQQGQRSLPEYVRWIARCRALITTDSLGLHLALAMKKPVLAIFGPTSKEQIPLYGRGAALAPDCSAFPCAPCFSSNCSQKRFCMDMLSVESVEAAFLELNELGNIASERPNFTADRIQLRRGVSDARM